MEINEILMNVAFYLFALIAIYCSYMVAVSTNIVRTAFSLLGVLFSFGAIYGMLRSDFLFAAQILVYVGGILVLIIFAIMLTHRISDVNLSNEKTFSPMAVAIWAVTFVMVLFLILIPNWSIESRTQGHLTALIGNSLMGEYLVPFEILSVLLLACLVGAVYLARKEVKE